MKILFLVLIIIFLQNCSFDNKTGIWKNENFNKDEKENIFRDFEKFSTKTEHFNKIINIKKNYVINLPSKVEPKNGTIYTIIIGIILIIFLTKVKII